jgi:hypothetical protein
MGIAGVISQQILGQQAASLSAIRQSAQEGEALAAILEQSAQTLAASSSSRGAIVNISV